MHDLIFEQDPSDDFLRALKAHMMEPVRGGASSVMPLIIHATPEQIEDAIRSGRGVLYVPEELHFS